MMASFHELLSEIQHDCGLEVIPYNKITVLARLCGPAEIDHLIRALDALDDADLADDAGDMGDEYWRRGTAYSEALAQVGEPAIEPLLRALGSGNPKTRAYAARSLGLIRTPRAFEPIAALLAAERDDGIEMALIEALGNLRDARAVPILLPYLHTTRQQNRGWIIRKAGNALGRIGTEEVIEPLAEVLASDSDWFARLGAAEGLRKIGHVLAREALARASVNDTDARVRAEAAAGLQ
jgi:HEAT repeat protein